MEKSNVCSFEHLSREGFHMRVIFIDDFSKSTAVYPLRSKNQTFQYFRHFHSAFEKQNSCSILSLVSENGGEYMGHKFQNHLCDKGIVHEPGTPPPPICLSSTGLPRGPTVPCVIACAVVYWVLRFRNLSGPTLFVI